MKHLRAILAIVAASMLYSPAVYSEEKTPGLPDNYGQYKSYELHGQKDECLIVAKNCIGGTDNVMKRVERLNREIEKGSAVYTPEELKSFRDELNWIYNESDDFSSIRM